MNPVERAAELEAEGLTPRTVFGRLKKEFPSSEWLDLKIAVDQGPTGVTPNWSEGSGNGRSVVIRNDPRLAEKKYDLEMAKIKKETKESAGR